MREIKFRGKSLYNVEWVYGFVLFREDTSEAVIAKLTATESVCENVDPATVGQFTGLHDKNGKEIYFGDIVRTKYGDIGSVIWFSDWSIRVDWGGGDIHFIDPEWGLEVIGNIHDNPELLKTE